MNPGIFVPRSKKVGEDAPVPRHIDYLIDLIRSSGNLVWATTASATSATHDACYSRCLCQISFDAASRCTSWMLPA